MGRIRRHSCREGTSKIEGGGQFGLGWDGERKERRGRVGDKEAHEPKRKNLEETKRGKEKRNETTHRAPILTVARSSLLGLLLLPSTISTGARSFGAATAREEEKQSQQMREFENENGTRGRLDLDLRKGRVELFRERGKGGTSSFLNDKVDTHEQADPEEQEHPACRTTRESAS